MSSDPARPRRCPRNRRSDFSTSLVANPRCASEMTYAGAGSTADSSERQHVRQSPATLSLVNPSDVPSVSQSAPGLATHELELRVRYAETDQMGVVYHTNYLVWCEVGRTELIRQLTGVSYAALESQGVLLAVADLSIRYHGAARYDDRVRVQTTLANARSRSVTFDYLITKVESGERLASARTVLVSIDRNGRPVVMPESLRQKLGRE